MPGPLCEPARPGGDPGLSGCVKTPSRVAKANPSFPRNRPCQNPNFGARKASPSFPSPSWIPAPLRHSRESGNPGVLEGSPRAVSPLHSAWIPAFAGMTISGAVAPLGWGFDTAWKAGIQGWWSGLQRRFPTPPRLDSRFRGVLSAPAWLRYACRDGHSGNDVLRMRSARTGPNRGAAERPWFERERVETAPARPGTRSGPLPCRS